jgi:hypothetical protein
MSLSSLKVIPRCLGKALLYGRVARARGRVGGEVGGKRAAESAAAAVAELAA